ncbi:aminotransferase class IV [Microbacterium sp. LRZ72]|uniref:aminotransferase class IV n=1 Tax=Microbacterium sp. LRZ72 TaxID=2942481 RepID=UPI0029AE46E9|nr:aminotransferase class IV [Microbacterium sp. LRZ72]MDX2375973.1 aminotransferase class IV [Microbacterium sp. LRZ72]
MTASHAFLVSPAASHDARVDYASTFTDVDAAAPALPLSELSAQRGDGVFETLGVMDGVAHEVDSHLDRFARSAALCELPAPNHAQWRQAVHRAAAEAGPGESSIKIVLSRGTGDGAATGWVTLSPAPDFTEARTQGIRVTALDRGVAHGVPDRTPWLLWGAKTLSYAPNMAALREAHRRGFDDALFVTSDGYVLEAPTASVLLRLGGVYVTPRPAGGILHGTTQISVFAWLEQQGHTAEYRDVRVEELAEADAAWLLSSVRLAAPVRMLDGRQVPIDGPLTAAMNAALLARGA